MKTNKTHINPHRQNINSKTSNNNKDSRFKENITNQEIEGIYKDTAQENSKKSLSDFLPLIIAGLAITAISVVAYTFVRSGPISSTNHPPSSPKPTTPFDESTMEDQFYHPNHFSEHSMNDSLVALEEVPKLTGLLGRAQLFSPSFLTLLTSSVFAHIHLDGFITNTNLEGSNIQTISTVLKEHSSYLPSHLRSALRSVTDNIEYIPKDCLDAQQRKNFAQSILKKVSELKENESLLLEGGWTSKPFGHAMLYEFAKRSDGHYDVIVYNTGAGSEYHHRQHVAALATSDLEKPHSSKQDMLYPLLEFQDISPEMLGMLPSGPDPAVFEKLIHIGIDPGLAKEATKQIYEETFAYFGSPSDSHSNSFFLETPQKSGTCSARVLESVLRNRFQNTNDYELFKFTLEKDSFYAFCSTPTILTSDELEKRELCKLAGEGLLAKIAKKPAEFLSLDVEEIQGTLQEIQRSEPRPASLENLKAQVLSYTETPSSQPLSWSTNAPPIESNALSISPIPPIVSSLNTFSQLQNELTTILNFDSPYMEQDFHFLVERVSEKLPSLSELESSWHLSEQKPEDLKKTQTLLSELLKKYKNSVVNTPKEKGRLPIEILTGWHLLAVIDSISRPLIPQLAKYAIEYRPFQKLIEDPLFICFSEKEFKKYEMILNYFQEIGKSKSKIFDFYQMIELKDDFKKIPDESLWEELISKDELKQMAKKNRHWGEYPALSAVVKERLPALMNDPQTAQELLSKENTAPLYKLRMAACLADDFLHNKRKYDTSYEETYSLESSTGGFSHRTFYLKAPSYRYQNSEFQSFPIPNENNAFDYISFTRNLDRYRPIIHPFLYGFEDLSPLGENKLMTYTSYSRSLPLRMTASTYVKSLQSAKLIEYFTWNLQDLTEETTQNEFLAALFQFYNERGAPTYPLLKDLKNKDFIQQIDAFIKKGLAFFAEGRPNIQTVLLFVQLSRRLKEIDPNLPLFAFDQKLNTWLNLPDLTSKEKDLLHLHRVLHYTSKKEKLSTSDLEEILISWTHCQQSKLFTSWQEIHSYKEASRFIFSLIPSLENLSTQTLNRYLNTLIAQDTSPIDLSLYSLDRKGTYYSFTSKSGDTWDLDLLHGKILHNQNPVIIGTPFDWSKFPEYQEIFEGKQFSYTREGEVYFFEALGGKSLRIFESNKAAIIQIKQNGKWLQYVPKKELDSFLSKSSVPKSLLVDHFVFASDDEIVCIHKKTHAMEFTGSQQQIKDHQNNSLIRPNKGESTDDSFLGWLDEYKDPVLNPLKETLQKQLDSPEHAGFPPPFTRFEIPDWIIAKQLTNGNRHLTFSRFSSLSGSPLTFVTENDGNIRWDSPTKEPLYLHDHPSNGSPLGVCQNYLFLQDKKQKTSKLLVPCKPIVASNTITPHADLDIQDTFRFSEYQSHGGELFSPQTQEYRFLEYDIKDGQVQPLTTEGELFLSYILWAQKDYHKAQSLIEHRIKKHLKMTPECKKILEWMIEIPLSSSDQSPSSTAMALKISLFLLREARITEDPNFEKLTKTFSILYKNYFSHVDRVQKELKLSHKQLKELEKHRSALKIPITFDLERKDLFEDLNRQDLAASKTSTSDFSENFKAKIQSFNTEFKDCYNAFYSAETEDEKKFLLIKYRKYLNQVHDFNDIIAIMSDYRMQKLPKLPIFSIQTKDAVLSWIDQLRKQYNQIQTLPKLSESKKHLRSENSGKGISELQRAREELTLQAKALQKVDAVQVPEGFPLVLTPLVHCNPLLQLGEEHFVQTYPSPITPFQLQMPQADGDYALRVGLDEVNQKLVKGNHNNGKKPTFSLKAGMSLATIQSKLQTDLSETETQIQTLQEEILHLANKLPTRTPQKNLAILLDQGNVKGKIALEKLVTCFLDAQNSKSYSRLNRHLDKKDIELLDREIQKFLLLSIKKNHLKNALANSEDAALLGKTLFQETAYAEETDPTLLRVFLVYEYRTGFKIRTNQVELIRKMLQTDKQGNYVNSINQLIMGGGKTSVISSILLHLAAKPGKIACFIPPAAQFTTLQDNLANLQKQHFLREIIPINFRRGDLTLKNLEWLQEQFSHAKENQEVLLTTVETVESLQLEFLSLLAEDSLSLEGEKKAYILGDLLLDLRTNGNVLVDEVDLILNPLRETNFPTGDKQLISESSLQLSFKVFTLLAKNKKLLLEENGQASLGKEARQQILEETAAAFFDAHKDLLRIDTTYKREFLDYVLRDILSPRLFQSISEKETTREQISLLRHLFSKVLPLTLSKSAKENYGREPGKDKVIHYIAVDTPSPTEIGEPWEAACYHFQTALSQGITSSQVQDFAHSLLQSAREASLYEGIPLEDTEEAKSFLQLSGVALREIESPKALEKAVSNINKNAASRLTIEQYTISHLVGSYLTFLKSNAMSIVDQFRSFRGLSGTLPNRSMMHPSLQKHVNLDDGAEGEILDTLLKRADPNTVHVLKSKKIGDILEQVTKQMSLERKNRLYGIIDVSGDLEDPLSVAQGILAFYQSDRRIQAVLFYGRDSKDVTKPSVPMVLKKGSKTPIIVGGTQTEELAKYGIDKKTTFICFDQYHSEATDIAQVDNAINLLVTDHRRTTRDATQGMLRNRSYLEKGDLEYGIMQEESSHFSTNLVPSHEEIVKQSIVSQVDELEDLAPRSYRQAIDHALRQGPLDRILQTSGLPAQRALMKQFRPVLTTSLSPNLPFHPESLQNSQIFIDSYPKNRLAFFQSLKPGKELTNTVQKQVQQVLPSPYMPKQIQEGNDRSQTQIQISMNQKIDMDQHVEVDQNTETDLELAAYQTNQGKDPLIEKPQNWIETGFTITNSPQISSSLPRNHALIYTTSNLLESGFKYQQDYYKIFTENLLISSNLAYAVTNPQTTSVFAKHQKPAEQLLVTKKNGKLVVLMISSFDADHLKRELEKNPRRDMWLMLPSGYSLLTNPSDMSKADRKSLNDLLWEVHLFNGNVAALLADPTSKEKFNKLGNAKDLAVRFLEMKTAHHPKNKELFAKHRSRLGLEMPKGIKN